MIGIVQEKINSLGELQLQSEHILILAPTR